MADQKNLAFYLGFSHFLGIGPIRFRALVNHFGSVKKAYQANQKDIEKIIGINIAAKFVEFRKRFDHDKKIEEIKRKKISVLLQEEKDYPSAIKNIPDPPICLYVKGNYANVFNCYANDNKYFAIVGTRKPTPYGEQIAYKFASQLATAGFIIVSGMAMGIDAIAHQAALDVNSKTIAFLGCGVDIIYPAINTKLYYRIINQGGLIISEFPPGHTVLPGLFIARNRLISGLSMGVLVVEGAKDSGAMITARYAGEQGREVFAPPSPLTSPMSEAPNNLLKQGAKLVISIDDILEEFGMRLVPKKKEDISKSLNNEEKIIFNCLEDQSKLVDQIILDSHLPVNIVLNLLSVLEIKGIIEKNSEGKYQIRY